MSKSKKNPLVLKAALELAESVGYNHVTRDQIADRAGVATGTVSLYMGTMCQLRRTVIRHALKEGRHRIIAQAIIADDPHVKKLTDEERRIALMAVA